MKNFNVGDIVILKNNPLLDGIPVGERGRIRGWYKNQTRLVVKEIDDKNVYVRPANDKSWRRIYTKNGLWLDRPWPTMGFRYGNDLELAEPSGFCGR